eukprot:scaffold62906_cov18-Tisochrysis_lutea.AAC.1
MKKGRHWPEAPLGFPAVGNKSGYHLYIGGWKHFPAPSTSFGTYIFCDRSGTGNKCGYCTGCEAKPACLKGGALADLTWRT